MKLLFFRLIIYNDIFKENVRNVLGCIGKQTVVYNSSSVYNIQMHIIIEYYIQFLSNNFYPIII